MLSESWVQSSVQHGGILGASEAARGIGMAEYAQGAPDPQSSSINFMHAAYMVYIPYFLVSCLKPKYFHHFSAISSSQQIGCFILGFWNMPSLTAWIWILHQFAPLVSGQFPFEPLETCRMVLCQCRCINTTNPWPWNREKRCSDLFNFFISKISKDIEEKINGKFRNSMYEESTEKSKGLRTSTLSIHLHREEVAKVISVPMICYEDWRCLGQRLKFNLSANVERCFTAHFALRSFEGAPSR